MSSDTIAWLSFCACLALSFLLSGMEAGVFALSRVRVRRHMRAGVRSAKVLQEYLDHPENFLWTILVGNTIANLLILGWIVVVLHGALRGHLIIFILIYSVIVLLFFAFFDLLPKTIFRLYPNRLCLAMARPFRVVHWLLRPFVVLVESVSSIILRWRGGKAFTGRLFGNREELRLVIQESALTLTSEEKAMINRVLDFQNVVVRQAMKPLAKVISIPMQGTVGNALAVCRQHGYTRLPVWAVREGRKHILGLVSCNVLMFDESAIPAKPLADYIRPAVFLDEDMRLEPALRRLQRSGQRLGIVLGRDKIETGIITLEDILRAIFGEVSL